MNEFLSEFCRDDVGAVTVDWVVLTAATVGLGIASYGVVAPGVEDLSGDIAGKLSESPAAGLMRTSFGLTIANGGFEDIAGMLQAGWGFYTYNAGMSGWQEIDDLRFEVVHDGYNGVNTAEGGYMLDLDASPGNMRVGQTLTQAVTGQTYALSFSAADPVGNNGVNVYYGGALVGSVEPGGKAMQSYSFDLVGGSGDGSDRLEIEGTGPEDKIGAYLDNIVVK